MEVDIDNPEPDLLDSPEAGGVAIRGVLVRTVLFAAGLIVSLITVPFLVRHLGPVEWGYYVSVTAIVAVIAGITEGGLTNLGIRYYSTEHDPVARGEIVRNLIGVRLVATTVAIALVTAVAALAGAAREIVLGLPLFGLGTVLTMMFSTYAVPLQAQLRLGLTAGLEFARQTANAVGTIALIVAGAGLYAFFGYWAVVCGGITVVTALIVRRTIPILPGFDWPTWRRFLGDAVAYGVASAAGLVYFRMGASLMTFLSTDLETGYFGVAFRVLETGAMVPWLLVTSVFPILARAATTDRSRLRYATQRVVEVGLIVGVAMTLVLVVGAKPVIQVIGGAEFRDAVPVLRVQGLVLIATVFVSTWSLLLLSLDEQRILLAINGSAVVLTFAAAFVLIPPLGAIGGSLDVLLAEVLVAVSFVVVLWRRHPDVAPDLRPLWRIAVAALVAAAASLPFGDVIATAVAVVVYALLLLALRAIPMELWDALRRSR
ncbi:MAG TPA: oligosaccharide flippase family protein [Solirubrobacter sp.]|nr:oligosaccharide flippase family protein [Solirubrobacter sp.]